MAVLCSKCGAEVPAGAQFCAVCGAAAVPGAPPPSASAPQAGPAFTPVSIPGQPGAGTQAASGYTPVQPPAPPAAAGYAPAGAYPGPVVARPQGGSSALKIILIVIAILVGLGMLGAGAVGFMVWRVAHAIHVANHGGELVLNTPNGSVSASNGNNLTPEDLGTDIYPGAQPTKGGMRMSLPTGSIVSAAFLTSDSKDQVLNFYKSKLGTEASVFDNTSSAMISLKKGSQESVMVTISVRSGEGGGKTKISIVHTKNKRPS
jgi:zinc-ribbon domain